MILSVSRRTDVPSYFSEWFIRRVREGYFYVRNPLNAHQISRIDLSPDVVDCIVFWTKNPANMLDKLDELKEYSYYFQFTLTGYGQDVEANLPDKKRELIPTFQKLAEKIGKERVVWRYDPILLNDRYTIEYHLKAFTEIADALTDCTERVVISFIDLYAKIKRNMKLLNMREMTEEDMIVLASRMAEIASDHNLEIVSCAERIDLQEYGVLHGSCIDGDLIERVIGCRLNVKKDKTQREECGCIESIDAGTYNTCRNGCVYCYANFNEETVRNNLKLYDPDSPLLCGAVGPEDKITERKVKSLKDPQLRLFD